MDFQILKERYWDCDHAIFRIVESVNELSEYGYVPMGQHQVLYNNGRYTVTQGVIKN